MPVALVCKSLKSFELGTNLEYFTVPALYDFKRDLNDFKGEVEDLNSESNTGGIEGITHGL